MRRRTGHEQRSPHPSPMMWRSQSRLAGSRKRLADGRESAAVVRCGRADGNSEAIGRVASKEPRPDARPSAHLGEGGVG